MKRSLAMAVVAAVGSCTIGAFQMVRGGSDGSPSMLVPIAPCRLFDTRPAPDNVGPVASPIEGGGVMTQAVHGQNGNCAVPTTATAVAMNVTVVGGTAASFLTIWPSDAPRPLASSLNWVPGAPPDAEQGRCPPVGRWSLQSVQPERHRRRARRRRRLLHPCQLGFAGQRRNTGSGWTSRSDGPHRSCRTDRRSRRDRRQG